MKKSQPKLYGYIKLHSRVSAPDVVKIDHNLLFIINSSLFITSPLNQNRGMIGLFHMKYKHKCNILSVCKMKMDFSFCTEFFTGPGSYDFSKKEEIFWLIFDVENKFTLISSTLCCTISSFSISSISGITSKTQLSMCGLKIPGFFAVKTPDAIFICKIRKKKEPEVLFEEKTMAIRIAPFMDGLLIFRNNSLHYYSNGKICNFYNTNHVSDFFITKDNRVVIIQKNDRNVVFHTIRGLAIGMGYVRLYTVLDDWAISICHGRHIVISNINDKKKGLEFNLTGQIRISVMSMKSIFADYCQTSNSVIIIIVTTRKVIFIKVSLDTLNSIDENNSGVGIAANIKQEEEEIDYNEDFEEEEEEEEEDSKVQV